MKTFSRRTVWLAMDGKHSSRLVAIAQEHLRLAREFIDNMRGFERSPENAQKIRRIDELRKEREEILQLYEEGTGEVDVHCKENH